MHNRGLSASSSGRRRRREPEASLHTGCTVVTVAAAIVVTFNVSGTLWAAIHFTAWLDELRVSLMLSSTRWLPLGTAGKQRSGIPRQASLKPTRVSVQASWRCTLVSRAERTGRCGEWGLHGWAFPFLRWLGVFFLGGCKCP